MAPGPRLRKRCIAALFCVLIFHSPDGSELAVLSDTIQAVKPIIDIHKSHVAPGTGSILYLGFRGTGFGVVETQTTVLRMLKGCSSGG